MLAADKLLLRSTVKQLAIQLREKELTLFNDNFNAVGTQSAVLAGFAMTSFAEIDLPHNAFYAQKACLHLCVTISICANLMCTASTTFVSVWGSGKALRGKDGSMSMVVEGMNKERWLIFYTFGVGYAPHCLAHPTPPRPPHQPLSAPRLAPALCQLALPALRRRVLDVAAHAARGGASGDDDAACDVLRARVQRRAHLQKV